MIDIFEILKKAKNGLQMQENDFNLLLSNKVARLVRSYSIVFRENDIIPFDSTLADSVFYAAVDLLTEVGLYVIDTGRIISFSEDEIMEAVKTAPKEISIGKGRNIRVLSHRKIEDKKQPIIFGGYAGTPISSEYYKSTALSYLKEPIIDAISHASISNIGELSVEAGTPSEIYATRLEIKLLREAIEESRRFGIHIIGGESSATILGDLAVLSSDYLKPSDAHLIWILNELKTDYNNLGRVVGGLNLGLHNVTLSNTLIGGFARNPEGVAIVTVANNIVGRLVYNSSYHITHPVHMFIPGTSNRFCLWVMSVVGQALSRNTNLISTGNVWTAFGAGTDIIFKEVAAVSIVATVSGLHPLGVVAYDGKKPNATGLEARFMGEVAHAVASSRLKREDANEIVLTLLTEYENNLKAPSEGKPFWELYKVKSVKPREPWFIKYQKAKKDIASKGIPIENV